MLQTSRFSVRKGVLFNAVRRFLIKILILDWQSAIVDEIVELVLAVFWFCCCCCYFRRENMPRFFQVISLRKTLFVTLWHFDNTVVVIHCENTFNESLQIQSWNLELFMLNHTRYNSNIVSVDSTHVLGFFEGGIGGGGIVLQTVLNYYIARMV